MVHLIVLSASGAYRWVTELTGDPIFKVMVNTTHVPNNLPGLLLASMRLFLAGTNLPYQVRRGLLRSLYGLLHPDYPKVCIVYITSYVSLHYINAADMPSQRWTQ